MAKPVRSLSSKSKKTKAKAESKKIVSDRVLQELFDEIEAQQASARFANAYRRGYYRDKDF